MALGNNPISRKPLHPISFEGCLHRAMEEIKKNGLSYSTVSIKVFEGTEILIPTIKPENKTAINAPTEMDERIIGFIREFSREQDDIYLGNSQQNLVNIPKKVIQVTVSIPLKKQLEQEGLIVTSK